MFIPTIFQYTYSLQYRKNIWPYSINRTLYALAFLATFVTYVFDLETHMLLSRGEHGT